MARRRNADDLVGREKYFFVLLLILGIIGPIFAFPCTHQRCDYLLEPDTAALLSGSVTLVASIMYLLIVVGRVTGVGAQQEAYLIVLVIQAVVALGGVVSTIVRGATYDGFDGLVLLGLAMQVSALAVWVLTVLIQYWRQRDESPPRKRTSRK